MKTTSLYGWLLLGLVWHTALGAPTSSELKQGFWRPPDAAKPWVYWWWLDSNATREGITRDLAEMKRQGIGGALVFDAGEGHGTPVGPLFMSPAWRELFKHAVMEAHRLGLQLSFNICSGWDCGGTWVTPEHALKRVVWSQAQARGPSRYAQPLPLPPRKDGYYEDIAVMAFRLPEGSVAGVEEAPGKTTGISTSLLPKEPETQSPAQPPLDRCSLTNLTDRMDASGRLVWDAPEGNWLILRFGQTLYGGGEGKTKLASPGAQGYEIDVLSAEALDRHFAETGARVAADVKSLAGRTLKYFHDDSWESGEPNWTPRLRQEFRGRRGYDLLPYLPVLAGKTVDNPEISRRFRRDLRRTIADLMAENHYGRLRDLARRWGMGVHAESGGPFYVSMMDALMNLGRNDIPMGEYWIRRSEPSGKIWYADQYQICDTVKQAATAAHIYGKRLCQAEAFTNMGRNWEEAPAMLKGIGDRAFCAGLTRNMLCFYVHQPYLDFKPGYEWPQAGTHFDRNLTWWNQMHAFATYLSRCQFLLQQGLFVADVCYFAGEDAPCYVPAKNSMKPPLPPGYDCDTINAEVLFTRVSVRNGRLTLPDGLSYRLLVLPPRDTMTPAVLRQLAALVKAGATVVGPKPVQSPSLQDYPNCDAEVQALAAQVWGAGNDQTITERSYGQGRVIWGRSLPEILLAEGIKPDFDFASTPPDAKLEYLHRHLRGTDVYFVSNQQDWSTQGPCTFRVTGHQPELWDPVTGQMRDATAFTQTSDGRTVLPLELPPRGSIFVVFRRSIPPTQDGTGFCNSPALAPLMAIQGPWTVTFDPAWGGPPSAEFSELVSWTGRSEDGIKYYSGTATYHRAFTLPGSIADHDRRLFLDLGEVRHLAEVRLNGHRLGVLWTKPFRVEVTAAAKIGVNRLEIDIVNLWPNRLIGDQRLPAAERFTKTNVKKFKPDSPLLESGLLGPVQLFGAPPRGLAE